MKKKFVPIILLIFILSVPMFAATGCKRTTPDCTTYDIWLDIGEEKIECTQSVYFVNDTDYLLADLKFNVYANAYDSKKPLACVPQEEANAYPEGVSYGKFELEGVFGEFQKFEFDFDSNIITVTLADPIKKGDSVKVDFVYDLTLPHTTLRYGFNECGISLTGFYPQLCALVDGEWYFDEFSAIGDPYFADTANYNVTFNVPEDCEYASSGKCKESTKDGEKFVSAKAENIRDFAIVLSADSQKYTAKHNGVQISYIGENPDVVEYAKKALDTYGKLFGKYAYDTLAIADMPFVAGGMEYGSLCVINRSLTGAAYEEVVAHEIAHQWWYSAVGSNNLCDAWQDEGLTSYATYLYFVNTGNATYADSMLCDAYTQFHKFCDIQNSVGEPVKGKLGGKLKDFPGNYYYVNLTYNKAMIMWKYMQDTIGKDNLIKALAHYYGQNKFAVASVQDMYDSIDEIYPNASALMQGWISNC